MDPTGLDTVVIITRDAVPYTFGLLTYGSHAAVRVDNGGNPMLYDPGGSYLARTRGSGDAFYGNEAALNAYTSYQRSTGSTVNTYRFSTTSDQERQIANQIEERGGVSGCLCASAVKRRFERCWPLQGRWLVCSRYVGTTARELARSRHYRSRISSGRQSSNSDFTRIKFDQAQDGIQQQSGAITPSLNSESLAK